MNRIHTDALFSLENMLRCCPQELDENVEYVEREDEFDVVVDSQDPEGKRRAAEKKAREEEEAVVSIDAIDTVSGAPNPSLFDPYPRNRRVAGLSLCIL